MLNPVLWNKEIFENKINCLEKIDFYKYLNDKMSVKKAFEAIVKHGAVLIENVIHFKLYFCKVGRTTNSENNQVLIMILFGHVVIRVPFFNLGFIYFCNINFLE